MIESRLTQVRFPVTAKELGNRKNLAMPSVGVGGKAQAHRIKRQDQASS